MRLTPGRAIFGYILLLLVGTLLFGGWGGDVGSWAVGAVSSLVAAALLYDVHSRAVANEELRRRKAMTAGLPDLPLFAEELDIGSRNWRLRDEHGEEQRKLAEADEAYRQIIAERGIRKDQE